MFGSVEGTRVHQNLEGFNFNHTKCFKKHIQK